MVAVVQRRFFNPSHEKTTGRFAPKISGGGGDVPAFKNPSEAAGWLQDTYGVKAEFTGMSSSPEDMVVIHDVCGGIKDAADKYPETVDRTNIGALRYVRSETSNNLHIAQTTPGTPFGQHGSSIAFNPQKMKDVNARGGGMTPDFLVAKDGRGCISHEMGHVYAATKDGGGHGIGGGGNMIMSAVHGGLLGMTGHDGGKRDFPSLYAQSNGQEMFAEVFTATVNKKAAAGFTGARGVQLKAVISDYNAHMPGGKLPLR